MQPLLALALGLAVLSAAAVGATCAQGASAPACGAAASEPVHAPLRFRKEPAVGAAALLGPYEILGGLALVGAAACWWRQRYMKGQRAAGAEELRLLAKRRLSAKSSLYVIEHGGREMMLAESERGITVIRDDSKP